MRTAAFVLEEKQIEFIKQEAQRLGSTSGSAVVRKIIGEAMAEQKAAKSPSQSEEKVSTN